MKRFVGRLRSGRTRRSVEYVEVHLEGYEMIREARREIGA